MHARSVVMADRTQLNDVHGDLAIELFDVFGDGPQRGTVTVDDEGFMTDPGQWSREVAEGLAADVGLDLTDRHWVVLDFVRQDTVDQGEPPGVRRITKLTDVSMDNPVVVIIISMIVGAIFGWVSEKVAGMLAGSGD